MPCEIFNGGSAKSASFGQSLEDGARREGVTFC